MSLMNMVTENRFIKGFLIRIDGFLLYSPTPVLYILSLTMLIAKLGATVAGGMGFLGFIMSPAFVKKLQAKVPILGKLYIKLTLFILIGGGSAYFVTRTPVIILANSVKLAAIEQVNSFAGVQKSEVEQDRNSVSLYVTVEDDIELERAKEIGEDFVKMIETSATKAGDDRKSKTKTTAVTDADEDEDEEIDEFAEEEEEEEKKKTSKKIEKPKKDVELLGNNFYEYKITLVRPDGVPLAEGRKPAPEINVIWK